MKIKGLCEDLICYCIHFWCKIISKQFFFISNLHFWRIPLLSDANDEEIDFKVYADYAGGGKIAAGTCNVWTFTVLPDHNEKVAR